MLRPESAFTPKLIRREARQLAAVTLATFVAWLSGIRVLQLVAGALDVLVACIAAIALVVAWRAVGVTRVLLLYVAAVIVLVALAAANFLELP
jgi:hypothetical protein